jgi:thiol-disulfide isomerase/thioredoxin
VEAGETEPAKQLAPDFTVYDLEGNAHKLSDFRGKPVILNFWATWCGYCKMEMPDFNELYLELGEDVHFLMVNCTDGSRETVETASGFIQEQGYSFPVYFDQDGSAAYAYSAYALPTTYFIDAQGHVVTKSVGAISADTLKLGIDMICN